MRITRHASWSWRPRERGLDHSGIPSWGVLAMPVLRWGGRMETAMRRTVTGLISVGLLLAACSGGRNEVEVTPEDPSDATTTSQEVTSTTLKVPSASIAAESYFRAFVLDRVEGREEMRKFSAEGSPARLYAEHFIALAIAQRNSSFPPSKSTMAVKKDGTVEVCDEGREGSCTSFSEFKADASDLLTSFSVDGKPIEGRLLAPSGEVVMAQGAAVRVLSGYKSLQSDSYFVIVEVKAGDRAITVYDFNATYVAPSGAQFTADGVNGLSPSGDIQPGASAAVLVIFPGASPGGQLVLEVSDATTYSSSDVRLAA